LKLTAQLCFHKKWESVCIYFPLFLCALTF
jgi:hypothetical protein